MTRQWLSKIDFPQLRKQRALLRAVAYKFEDQGDQSEYEALVGLSELLDDLMDHAEKVLGARKVFGAASKNHNCLHGIRCPRCKQHKSFSIGVQTVAMMTDDGSDDTGSLEWDGMSGITCLICDHHGRVWEFQQ